MSDRDLTFRSGGVTIAGTLTVPQQAAGTVVVLVSGSGRVDRNSDDVRIPLGVSRDVAEHLAANGIASYRYDKRGVGASEGDYFSAGLHDNVADAAAAVSAVRAELGPAARRVVVLGHSEGALIATALADGRADVDGVVLLSGAAVPGEQVLLLQGERVAEVLGGFAGAVVKLLRIDVSKQQRKQIEKLRGSTTDTVGRGPAKVNARWFREFLAFDPAPLLAAATVPVLAVTGAADVQVDPADVDRMRELVPTPFEGHVLDGVNHILRAGDPSPTTYKRQASDPIDPGVLDVVTEWLGRDVLGATPERAGNGAGRE